ncbi:hypothetical protein [Haloarchaeobius baliensis]|uniref:hypothetical protein n=1 Tax=Haloarchaeobius baliensis TaxID=1670458 RepID=UPI003F88454B
MAENVFSGWNNPEYRWYYAATTFPVMAVVFLLTMNPTLTILTVAGMSFLWWMADLAT